MKRADIKPCACCGNGVARAAPVFYTVQIRHHVLDSKAVASIAGLEQVFGGGTAGAVLADVMGPNPDISQQLNETGELWICFDCAMGAQHIAVLAERAAKGGAS